LHNYSAANSVSQKLYNWNTMNQKVLKRIDIELSAKDIDAMVNCEPGRIERLLKLVQDKVEQKKANKLLKEQQRKLEEEAALRAANKSISQTSDKTMISTNIRMPERGNDSIPHTKAFYLDPYVQTLLDKKDQTIKELQEHVAALEAKVNKYDQLVKVKDSKITKLSAQLQRAGLSP